MHFAEEGVSRYVSTEPDFRSRVFFCKVILETANEVCQTADWKDKVLADPEVPGLQSFGDSSLNIRLVVKTQPGAQWSLARALRKRIKERFDEEGIEIPFPQRVIHHVHTDDSKTSSENPKRDEG